MTEPTTEQEEKTTNNPDGIGGFGDNPENINKGGRPKNEQRFSYWLQFFKNLTMGQFNSYIKDVKKVPEMYVAERIAYTRVKSARDDLQEYKDVADRTEGRPKFRVEHEGEIVSEVTIRVIKDASELEDNDSI